MTTLAVSFPTAVVGQIPKFQCVACGSDDGSRRPVVKARESRPFDLLRCTDCGLVQQHPRYSRAEFSNLYADDYYARENASEHLWARAVQHYLMHLAPLEPANGRHLLDVGSGRGHFSALARRRGWRTVGIDLNPRAVSDAAQEFGIDVRAGTLSSHRAALGRFDVAFIGDCLEHVLDPAALLTDVRSVLNSGGVACIDTPNWGSRWRWLVRRHWLGLNRYHINLFDAGALSRVLETCGFGQVQLGSYTHYRYESWSARPEVQYLLGKLPLAVAWRVNRWLERFLPLASWLKLRRQLPDSLEDAMNFVDRSMEHTHSAVNGTVSRDNLIATAVRVRPRADRVTTSQ
jgi:2-polyprenyl-3-methyl-5-hydroxy-6-metoxy-1,4-benzoquinol methylase